MYSTNNIKAVSEALDFALSPYGVAVDYTDAYAPTDNERRRWLSVKESIQPHLFGQMPSRITRAFLNEQKNQRQYREEVYCSRSSALLGQAIDNVYKIVQSDDFVISYDAALGDVLQNVVLGDSRLGGTAIQRQVLDVIYKARVLDPNGYFGLVYRGDAARMAENAIGFKVEIYPSENIVIKGERLMVFATSFDDFGIARVWRAYTPFCIVDFDYQGAIVGEPYFHRNAGLSCHILGGKTAIDEEVGGVIGTAQNQRLRAQGSTRIVKYQQSDFSFATAQLDQLEIISSECDVCMYLHAHPIKLMVEINCQTCSGAGEIQDLDSEGYPMYKEVMRNGRAIDEPVTHKCGTCNGKGTLSTGSQDVITIPNTSPMNISDAPRTLNSLKDTYVAYITPDIASANFLKEAQASAMNECKEMLNLHRLEDFSQSGVSKSIDREAGFTRLRAIAEGVGNTIESLLKMVNNTSVPQMVTTPTLENRLQSIEQSINVAIPSYFDMRTTGEALASYFEQLPQKDNSQRYNEYLNILKKRNASAEEIAAFDVAYDYTNGLNLSTNPELLDLMGAGIISEAEFFAAKNIDAILKRIKRTTIQRTGKALELAAIFDYTPVIALIDMEVAKYEDKRAMRTQAPVLGIPNTDNDSTPISE